jgi:hypothetical protein
MTTDAAPTLLIKDTTGISPGWLGRVLDRPVHAIDSVTAIGTGQMSQSHRVTYSTSSGNGSVVVKLASDDETSRATGVGMGAYRREVEFYRHLGDRIGGPVPRCALAAYDDAEGWFTLVLEDIADGSQGDQIAGCSVEEARRALRELAAVHAPVFNDIAVGTQPWLNQANPLDQTLLTALLPAFVERYRDRAAPEHLEVAHQFVPRLDAWWADRRAPLGLVHGDFRLDNVLFTPESCAVVDWQTVTWGPVMLDAAYFLGGALEPQVRREHEENLVRTYHDALVARGIQGFSWQDCWEEYRRQVFWGVAMAVAASMVVVQTERGDEMFMAMFARHCQQAQDLGSLALLPEPGAKPAPLVPTSRDEGLHQPGPEDLWNESFYFDAATQDGQLGLYVRAGRLPNRNECAYTACVVRAGEPTVMVVDLAAPLPAADDGTQRVETDRLAAMHECVEPLQVFRVRLDAAGEAYADPSAVLRGESGRETAVSLDLTWTTDGSPYSWRASTRYEIPCRVTGSVIVDGQTYEFDGPGQRDHSHGSRDWWANDWMWSAFHLEDGTRTHAVTLPDLPGFAVGYTQRDGRLVEVETGSSTHEDGGHGMPVRATVAVGPDAPELEVTPVAHGPLLLVAPDGRVAHFHRAMATVSTSDGRRGVGWIEWNRNQPA